MPDKLVTVARFREPVQAHLAQTKLKSEGIWSFTADDQTISIDWFYSLALGQVKLQVRESDVQRAIEVFGIEKSREGFLTGGVGATESDRRCGRCGSVSVQSDESLRPARLVSFLRRVPLAVVRRKSSCLQCGHQWRERRLVYDS
jgi:hypothetical protein